MAYMDFSGVQTWAARVETTLRDTLAREASGHDVEHAFRVRNLAVKLAAVAGADLQVVEATALLHDVGHLMGREDHAANGAAFAGEFLVQSGFPREKIHAVVGCIQRHHWKPGNAGDPLNPSLEYQVFADADRLDAIGAIGIARAFAFGGAHGRPIWTTGEASERDAAYGRSSVHHFYDKLLQLDVGMYTAVARRLAARRSAILKDYLKSFFDEWELRDFDAPARATHPTDESVNESLVAAHHGARSENLV